MSSQEGRQSPPPETQTGAQLNTAPGDGQGTDTMKNKDQANKSGLDVRLYDEHLFEAIEGLIY